MFIQGPQIPGIFLCLPDLALAEELYFGTPTGFLMIYRPIPINFDYVILLGVRSVIMRKEAAAGLNPI